MTIILVNALYCDYCGQTRPVFLCWTHFWTQHFGWVRSGWPSGSKTGTMGLGWPQIGFKFGFNPIMYLINPNEPDLNPISGRVGAPGSKFGLSRVGLGPQGPNSGWVGSGWSGSFGLTTVVALHITSFRKRQWHSLSTVKLYFKLYAVTYKLKAKTVNAVLEKVIFAPLI